MVGVTEQSSPLEQALDLVLYAPVGLAVTVRDELPHLIEKGRQQVTSQVTMARMIGHFVAGQGQRELAKVAKQATDLLAGLGLAPSPGHDASRQPAARTSAPAAPAPAGPTGPVASNGNAADVTPAEPAATSDSLAIPGYDSLSASQVVQRLAGLAPGELEAVRGYEATTRGRRTILNRIAQLQAGVG
jgi:hypothetical protein